ncbi:hypothetical protein V3W47_06560 [Deinococcus sp. YIM 134068]|uniref:hypothetical protein n=1 Tax=Deinococcus lichenicola TaxID=3118910 RepID=UPI002F93F248
MIEYVGEYPSRQIRIILRDGTGYTEERRKWSINSAHDWGLLTDQPLDLSGESPAYDDEGRADCAPIAKEEFEAAWIKSFEFLSRSRPDPSGS